jgi:uncharacterized protein YrzB (UPF0473 family)
MNTLTLTALSVYNTVTDVCSKGADGFMRFLHSLSCYLSGTSNQWYFMLHNIGPIPASHYSNTSYSLPSTVEWIFDSYELTSTLNPSIQRHSTVQYATLPFLSANITVHDRTFSLDEFLQNFKIEFTADNIPEPLHILRFWSITRSLWFTVSENPVLNVIDNEGNDHSFSIFGNHDMDLWNSFFVVYSDEEEEEEQEEEDEQVAGEEQPVVESVTEPLPEPVVEAVTEPPVEPVVEAITEPLPDPVVEAVIEPSVEPVVEAATEQPVVEAATEQPVEPVVESATEQLVVEAATEEPVTDISELASIPLPPSPTEFDNSNK